MNKHKFKILSVVLLVSSAAIATIGCKHLNAGLTTTNPVTGVQELDVAKVEKVKAALSPLISAPLRRVIKRSPEHAAEICTYARSVGTIFCQMEAQKKFSPEFLVDQVTALSAPAIAGLNDEFILSSRDAVIALYKICYADRFTAELPPDQWPAQVASLFCGAIDQALKDVGQPGVK